MIKCLAFSSFLVESGIYKKYQDGVQILAPILDGASHLHIFQVFTDPKSENHNIRSPISAQNCARLFFS